MKNKKIKFSVAVLSSMVMMSSVSYAYDITDYTGDIKVEGRRDINYSSSRVVDDEVYLPLDELGVYTEKEGTWDKSSNTVNIRYKNEPIESPEELEGNRFPLLASIPEKNLYLYGLQPQGMVLYREGKAVYVEGEYLTPRFILPTIVSEDFDGDKKDEVALILTTGTGTGISLEELCVVAQDQDQTVIFNFKEDSYLTQLKEHLTLDNGKKSSDISLNVDQQQYQFTLTDKTDTSQCQLSLGRIVHFYAEGSQLKGEFALGVTINSQVEPEYLGIVAADINFDKTRGFSLEKIQFVQSESSEAELKQRAEYLVEKDLEVESFFNGTCIDSTVKESPYAPYYPVPQGVFQTRREIEDTLNDIYASQTRKNHFLSYLDTDQPYYKEIGGKLYGNKNSGGRGMPLKINEIRLGEVNGNRGVILCDYEVLVDGFEPGTLKLPMSYEEGKWKLETGVYEVWSSME